MSSKNSIQLDKIKKGAKDSIQISAPAKNLNFLFAPI